MANTYSFMINAETRKKLAELCFAKRSEMKDYSHLLDYKHQTGSLVKLARSNTYSYENINNVTFEGKYCFSTWNMGDRANQIARLTRLRGVNFRKSVCFFVPANHVVPEHLDDSKGRDGPHLTLALNDTGCVLHVDQQQYSGLFTAVFSPVVHRHFLVNGNKDLLLFQIPVEEINVCI